MCFRRSVSCVAGRSWGKAYGCHHAAGPSTDDWLNFMLSQKNLWPTFTTRSTVTEEVSEQVFSRERRRLQAKHLWMEVKLRWRVLEDSRLKPDVRDPPENIGADVVWLTSKQWMASRITTWWKRTNEGLRGARCFTLSHLVLRISLVVVLLSCACWLVCLGWFAFCFVLLFSGF